MKELTTAEMQKQVDDLQTALDIKKAKEKPKGNGFGACATETVLRNGVECDINVGDFNSETDERIGKNKAKKGSDPLLDILDGNVGEVTEKLEEVDSVADLDKLLKAEESGNTRIGAVSAIKKRIAALQE